MITKFFTDRRAAGRFLAAKLAGYKNNPDVMVLALPRGGVPVAFEVAQALSAPLDVFLVRKLGVPGYPELAMGAVASSGITIINALVVNHLRVPDRIINSIIKREQNELERVEKSFREGLGSLDIHDRTVIVVDDGMATGATMRSAVRALRQRNPAKIIVAVPVAARDTCESFMKEDQTSCVSAISPEPFDGVGLWYTDYSQTSDEEVRELLARARGDQVGKDIETVNFNQAVPNRTSSIS